LHVDIGRSAQETLRMTDTKTYTGGCHCGKVRFETKVDLGNVLACNCSICAKAGLLLAFTSADQFKLLSGEDGLTDYQFNKKKIHHLFCATCGVRSFARGTAPDGKEMRAINVRCLDDVDIDALTPRPFDGKNM
jgi:hypothetical protein